MAFHIVIPSRFGSSRLPGKPLLEINGFPLIWHVYLVAKEIKADSVVVATDDTRIYEIVKDLGGDVCMTSTQHESGTDRLAEVSMIREFCDEDIIVNLQGDEPLVEPKIIEHVRSLLVQNQWADVSTLCCSINDRESVFNPNVVKVVTDELGKAMYFSRAPIPWDRDHFSNQNDTLLDGLYFRHVGIYAYRVSALKKITRLPVSSLEDCEKLEQLRFLQNGLSIVTGELAKAPHHGVDTEEDYMRVKELMERNNG